VEFKFSDLGHLSGGDVVHVVIRGDGPNVRIFDRSNFQSFKNGQRAEYHGGHAQRSPVAINVPYAANWFLVIDFGGNAGRANYSYRVLKAA
jgi:hypothetical protein